MTDQIKKASKSDMRFAIIRASRALDLAMEFNARENATANFAGVPRNIAFDLARNVLYVIGVNGEEIVRRAISCGEHSPADLNRIIAEIAEEDAYSALPECESCGAKVTPGECCRECWTECAKVA